MRFFFARVIPRMSYIAAWGLHRFPSFRELTNCTWKNKVAYHSNDQVINLIKGMKSQNRKYWQWTCVQLKVIPRNLGYKSKLNSIFFLWGRGGLHSEELITRVTHNRKVFFVWTILLFWFNFLFFRNKMQYGAAFSCLPI